LWHRPAAVAPIQPLDRELPNAAGSALKKIIKGEREREREQSRSLLLTQGTGTSS